MARPEHHSKTAYFRSAYIPTEHFYADEAHSPSEFTRYGVSSDSRMSAQERNDAFTRYASERPTAMAIVRAGLIGGLVGGIVIWIYEALIWVGAQHLMPLSGIPPNATGLVFGKKFQLEIGGWAYVLGTGIHFVFAFAWGILFAAIWPNLRRHGYEATFVALFYAVVAWIVMHVAISIASNDHPNYHDPVVIIGGIMSHFFFAVPMALVVKRLMSPHSGD
jgi:hypothetical protein